MKNPARNYLILAKEELLGIKDTKKDPRGLKNISGGSRKTQFKKGKRPDTVGENNNNWKGGRIKKQNYWWIRDTEHPCNFNGYVAEHRWLMEILLGRLLLPDEVIHHKDGNPLNNNLDNLQLCENQAEHLKLHNYCKK